MSRTYVMDYCFSSEDSNGNVTAEVDARIHYTLSGDPRDRDLEIEVTLIEVDGEMADPCLYEMALEIGTEPFLANAAGDAAEAARERRSTGE